MRRWIGWVLGVVSLSCSEAPRGRPEGAAPASRAAVVQAAARCLYGDYQAFVEQAEALEAAVQAHADAPEEAGPRTDAREAWRQAMDGWQRLEPGHIGPAAPPSSPGGLGQRDEIYSWPLVSRCTVEQTLVSQAFTAPDFASVSLVNARGLAALEYLLFYDGADNGCGPQASLNTGGAWAALSPAELRGRKAAYARVVSADVARRARALVASWAPEQGNFLGQATGAGADSTTYASVQMALNALSDALIAHLDKETKDRKLGRPLGLSDCATERCPEALESRHARLSKQHIAANLAGSRRRLLGCGDGEGFDDLLRAAGAGDLAGRLERSLDLAIAAVDAIPSADLEQALAEQPASVEAAHAAVKAVTDLLRTEFASTLDLELPKLVEGDND